MDLETLVDREALNVIANAKCRTQVLVLDDEQLGEAYLVEKFTDKPVDVHLARTTEQADSILEEQTIHIVVVDIDLGVKGESGEVWLVKNRERLRGVHVEVLTGHAEQIQDQRSLEEFTGHDIRIKGESDAIETWNEILEFAYNRARQFLKQELGHSSEHDHELVGACVSLFETWASSLPASGAPVLFCGDLALTSADLIGEVRAKTTLGRTLLRLFIEDQKRQLLD